MHESRTYIGDRICDTLKKRERLTKHARGNFGAVALAHPTKKLTRGRLRTAYTLPRGHRQLTMRQLRKLLHAKFNPGIYNDG